MTAAANSAPSAQCAVRAFTMRCGDMTVSPSGSKFTGKRSSQSWIFRGVLRRANNRRSAGVSRSFSAFGGISGSTRPHGVSDLFATVRSAGHAGPAFSTEPVPQEGRSLRRGAEGRYLLIFQHLLPVAGAGFYLQVPREPECPV